QAWDRNELNGKVAELSEKFLAAAQQAATIAMDFVTDMVLARLAELTREGRFHQVDFESWRVGLLLWSFTAFKIPLRRQFKHRLISCIVKRLLARNFIRVGPCALVKWQRIPGFIYVRGCSSVGNNVRRVGIATMRDS